MRERLWVAAALGGVATLAVLAVVVFRFGIKDPSPPSMTGSPNAEVTGRIAFVSIDGCLEVVEASGGEPQRVTCGAGYDGMNFTWLDDRHLAYGTYTAAGIEWRSVEIESGDEAPLGTTSPSQGAKPAAGELVSPRGERLLIEHPEGDVYRVEGADRVRIFDYDGPDSWTPEFVTWSPDGEWVLLRYGKEEELWVVRRDGSFAGTVVDDAGYWGASWWIAGIGALPEVTLPGGG